MKPEYNFKRDSWHYKLAKMGYEDLDAEYETDTCSYLKYMFKGLFILVVVSVVGILGTGTIVFMLGSFIGWLLFCAFNWEIIEPSPAAAVTAGVALVSILGWVLTILYNFVYKQLYKISVAKDKQGPGIFTLAYRKFKDKHCSLITFE